MSRPSVCYIGGEDVEMRIPLLLRLRELNFEVSAIGSRSSDPFDRVGIRFERYELVRSMNPWADRRSQSQLQKLLTTIRPDVVHAFDTKPTILAMLASRAAGVAGRIRTITGMGYVFSSTSLPALMLRPVYRAMQRRSSAACTFTIFQNEDDQKYFIANRMVNPLNQTVVLGSGIDCKAVNEKRIAPDQVAAFRSQLDLGDSVVVIMVARLVRQKGVLEFLKAARLIHRSQSNLNVRFLLVGPTTSEGRQAISSSELEAYSDVVQHLGARSDVPALLSTSDIFVLPSYYREGVPRVLLEAGALGLPLITTDMPGCREVVKNGCNGILVPPRDEVALAKAITELVADPVRRHRMGDQSRQWVSQRFELSLVTNQYARQYQHSIDARQAQNG